MSLPVKLDRLARREFEKDYEYYEGERAGLGDEYADEVRRVLERIARFPPMHTEVYRGVRRAVVDRFSYCVYYREEIDHIRVVSIFHTSRNPSLLKKRV